MSALFDDVGKGAVLDPTGRYRFQLWRLWGAGQRIGWIGLNPSVADASKDDPTIRRMVRFARDWGYDGITVVNLFPLRATDPRQLQEHALPEDVRRANLEHILAAAAQCPMLIAAWGVRGGLDQTDTVTRMRLREAGRGLWCLRKTKAGHPEHPLYVPANTKPQVFA